MIELIQNFTAGLIKGIAVFATDYLIPAMLLIFTVGVVLRILISITVKREEWFAKEFEKRVHNYLTENERHYGSSFYITVKGLLEKTYYELFELRAIMKRRKPDYINTVKDRLFLIQHGSAWLVKDTLKQMRFLKYNSTPPKILEIVKSVFKNNPCFNKIFGLIQMGKVNDFLNILPGIFIVFGIFGTFLGIMNALPELTNTEVLSDANESKKVMDQFLLSVSFSMSSSIIGIIVSVLMTFFNTFFSSDKTFISLVDRFENSLDLLWNSCDNNSVNPDTSQFDEHKDPIDALAEEALNKELGKNEKSSSREKKAS
ncbi:hypothetical protein N9W41_00320 [bacterium]|nr:hypothetical protein [bacterium]